MNSAPNELSEQDFKKLQGQYQAQYGITMNKQVLLLFEMQKAAHLQELNLIQSLYQQQKQENATMYQEQIRVLEQKMNQDKQQHDNYIQGIDKAVVAIGKQKGAIITDNPKVVVQHSLIKYGIMGFSILLLCGLLAFMYDRYFERQEEYRKITNALIDYPKIYKYDIVAQKGEILVNPDGREGEYLVLTITPKGERAQAGINYFEDPENKRILVPLHFSKQAHAN